MLLYPYVVVLPSPPHPLTFTPANRFPHGTETEIERLVPLLVAQHSTVRTLAARTGPGPAHSRACSTAAARSRDAFAAEHEGGDKRARGTMRAGHMPRQSAPHAPRSLYLWARLDSPPAAATHAARSPRSTLAGCSLLPRCRQ